MTDVIGSKQYRSIVVRYRPWQRVALILLVLAIMVSIALASAYIARTEFADLETRLLSDNSQLRDDVQLLQKQRDDAQQQLVNVQMAATVDRGSVDEVRRELKGYQDTIAELTEEISFYKGLMSPSERERGLSVRDLTFYKTSSPQLFQYKLILQQTALKHRLLRGSVRVVIVGSANNADGVSVQRRYALADLSAEIKAVDIPLRFKYFQNIEGELKLPAGFDVEKIELVARASSPKKVQIEKTYEWLVQG